MALRKGMAACLLAATAVLGAAGVARADTTLWIDDINGVIGTVDLTTQTVTVIGNTGLGGELTDIAFDASNNLYGTTFSGLYSINQSNASTTSLGSYNVGSGGMNALVGDGANLLGASTNVSGVYSINPGSPGSSASYAASPGSSAGDLAFAGGTLYEAIADPNTGYDALADITTNSIVGDFTGDLTGLDGLAYANGVMYAVDGTEIYSVNLSTAALTPLFNYSASGLSDALGAAVQGEAVPEPASLLLFGSALGGLGAVRRRRKQA